VYSPSPPVSASGARPAGSILREDLGLVAMENGN
jgi:hypothetical protein